MANEYFDVLIIGAGLSGVGAAVHLQKDCPNKTYAILEGRDRKGGTWDLFRYPGIRSDSDMYTLGYNFKPWKEQKAIADGPSILKYIHETAQEYDVEQHIRYNHWITSLAWDSNSSRWTVTANRGEGEAPVQIECNYIIMCAGYYRYSAGYTPDYPGLDTYKGEFVHPQHWPEDLDYAGKKVVVIGSGATAVTLAPEMAKDAEHVVMLQRSPTYMATRPSEDKIALGLRKIMPASWAYSTTRWKNVLMGMYFFNKSRKDPKGVKTWLIDQVKAELPDYDVEKHFTPYYNPWEQRLCAVPDSDLFAAIREGDMSVVTDHIETFTENGIKLKSGEELDADIIVSATGLELEFMGGADVVVDGTPVNFAERFGYKGMMFSDVPNLTSVFGYTNASWTLKADLTCDYVCRLLNHMSDEGATQATPRLRDANMDADPWLDFSSGYVTRAMHRFPKQGKEKPWRLNQNYALDIIALRTGKLEDGVMEFSSPNSGANAADDAAPVAAE